MDFAPPFLVYSLFAVFVGLYRVSPFVTVLIWLRGRFATVPSLLGDAIDWCGGIAECHIEEATGKGTNIPDRPKDCKCTLRVNDSLIMKIKRKMKADEIQTQRKKLPHIPAHKKQQRSHNNTGEPNDNRAKRRTP